MKKTLALLFALLPTLASAGHLEEGIAAIRSGNYNLAYNIITPLAKSGNPDAQFHLCGMYYQAQGVPKNDFEAARWCREAALNTNIEAMYNLALLYQNGEGVGQNLNEAKYWYKEAAIRGHKGAEFNLAELDGTGFKIASQLAAAKIPTIAEPLVERPEQLNTPNTTPSTIQIAAQLPKPKMMPPAAMQPPLVQPMQQLASTPTAVMAPTQQMQPVQMASMNPQALPMPAPAPMQQATAPSPQQLNMLETASGRIRTVPDNAPPVLIVNEAEPIDPITACKIAEQEGKVYDICKKEPLAQKELKSTLAPSKPLSHSFNLDTEHNFNAALEAAKKGDAIAQNNLGSMYMNGKGVAKNTPEAIKWLEKAASRGNVQAMLNLATIYQKGEGVTQNPELAYSWYNLAADRSKTPEERKLATENVQFLSKSLTNEQIGNALQFVTKLDQKIPQVN